MAATKNYTVTFSITDLPTTVCLTAEAARGTPDIVIQQYAVKYADNGAAIAAETAPIHIALKAGTINAVEAMLSTNCAAAGPEDVTVDIQKSTGAGAYATILTAPITFLAADADRAVKAASIDTAAYI